MPRWRADGRELFFLAGPGSLMVTTVSTAAADFVFEPARALFEKFPQVKMFFDKPFDPELLLKKVKEILGE